MFPILKKKKSEKKENIYQNNIAILSMSRVDEESGRPTVQFNPPSHTINSSFKCMYTFASSLISNQNDFDKKPITLNDVLVGNLSPQLFNGTWILDNIVFYDEETNLCTLHIDFNSTQKHILVPNHIIFVNNDCNYSSFIELLPEDQHFGNQFIQHIEWGPNGTQIVFVFKNNLYYKADVNAVPIQLTNTGAQNLIYNGYCDWVYEEEILEEEKAFWLSPDGKHLVFAKINDSKVDTITWPFYGQYYNLSSNQYPSEVALKYPKPGRNNPTIEIFVLNLNESVDNIELVRLLPPETIAKHDYYVTAVGWIDNDRLSITWLTRAQNYSTFTLESANSWVDLYSAPIPGGRVLIFMTSAYNSCAPRNQAVKYLTKEIVAFNPQEDIVYFLSTLPEKPEFRHLMSVSVNEESVLDPICWTCYLGQSCLYNNVFFNTKRDYYVLQCEGPDTPKVEIRRTKNNSL
ncbi:unnamed protein product, partial [Medioppia subpectinata]